MDKIRIPAKETVLSTIKNKFRITYPNMSVDKSDSRIRRFATEQTTIIIYVIKSLKSFPLKCCSGSICDRISI